MNLSQILGAVVGSLVVSSCGGGGAGSTAPVSSAAAISGTLSGWSNGPSNSTLLLNNSGIELIAVTTDGSFSFAKRITEGNSYNVTVLYQPNGAYCVVANGVGTVAHGTDSVSNVSVTCTSADVARVPLITFYVGVTVSGLLSGNSVTLSKNGVETLTATGNGLFVFLPDGATAGQARAYEVTVKTGPANQSCTVTNGSGTLAPPIVDEYLVNIPVTCK